MPEQFLSQPNIPATSQLAEKLLQTSALRTDSEISAARMLYPPATKAHFKEKAAAPIRVSMTKNGFQGSKGTPLYASFPAPAGVHAAPKAPRLAAQAHLCLVNEALGAATYHTAFPIRHGLAIIVG